MSADAKRFEILYDYFSPVLFGIIKKIVKQDKLAEDILQESFLKIWNSAQFYDSDKSRLFTWILNIARNTAIDYIRSKQGKLDKKLQSVDGLLNINEPHSTTGREYEHIGLKKIVTNLKTEHTEIINLSFFEGYTHSEIAEKLQIPLGTVKTRCRNALLTMRKSLSEHN